MYEYAVQYINVSVCKQLIMYSSWFRIMDVTVYDDGLENDNGLCVMFQKRL